MSEAAALPYFSPDSGCPHCLVDDSGHSPCPHCGYVSSPPQRPHPLYLPPLSLLKNQYRIGHVLGQGGFGITYIGLDLGLHKRVAIKEYLPAVLASRDPDTLAVLPLKNQDALFAKGMNSFLQEARNLARFDHPHIVRVVNYFEANQTAYMVMEYVAGDSLAQRLHRQTGGRLPPAAALALMLPVLDALEAIHAQQVYHLDISAHNVLNNAEDQPVLIDFGAARSLRMIADYTHSMTLVLKPGYSPLEQYSEQGRIGPWTDVYACGALLYLLLSGQLPPAAPDRWHQDRLQPVLSDQPSSQTQALNAALRGALALRIEDRWPSVGAFRQALIATPRRRARWPLALLLLPPLLGSAWLALGGGLLSSPMTTTPPISAERYQQQAAAAPADQAVEILQTGLRAWPQDAALRAAYQQALAVQGEEQAVQQLLDHAQVLRNAERRLDAIHSYRAVLQLRPGHTAALAGLTALSEEYQRTIAAHLASATPTAALDLLKEALSIWPQEPRLRAWQQQLENPTPTPDQTIQALWTQLERQLRDTKLTTPAHDNAYATYQSLRQQSPQDPQVQALPTRIASHYQQLALQQTDLEKKQGLISKGLELAPNHAGLLALQNSLLATEKPTPPAVPAAPVVPTTTDVAPPAPAAIAAAQLAQLLARARQQQAAGELEAAQASYQSVLRLAPEQAEATRGLQALAENYAQQARQQRQAGHLADSLLLVAKGLSLVPGHVALSQLQEDIRQQISDNKTNNKKTLERLLTPSF